MKKHFKKAYTGFLPLLIVLCYVIGQTPDGSFSFDYLMHELSIILPVVIIALIVLVGLTYALSELFKE